MDFQQFLQILWLQKATGETGFEGLVRKLLEKITSQRFFLSLSGRQEGRDMASDSYIGNFVAVECKRYEEGTPLGSDELLVKFLRAAKSITPPDIWIVVTTKRLGEQHHRDLQSASDQYGISYFAIDAEGGESSLLLAICSSAPEIVADHLQTNQPMISNSQAKEVEGYLSDLSCRDECSDSRNWLQAALMHDTIGYAHWRTKQNEWLSKRFKLPKESIADFAQDFAIRAPERKPVKRSRALQVLDDWWDSWPKERKSLVILGEEGDGKSWVVADWLADKFLQGDFPPVLLLPSIRLSKAEPMEITIEALQWQIGEARSNYWSRRLNRWLDSPSTSNPAFLLVLDGVNERPGFEWKLFLARLEVEPFAERVSVLMTCRTLFWEERLHSEGGNCVTWILEPYDEYELTQALTQYGYQKEVFDNNLLPLLKKPRYFDLTVKLRDRLSVEGEVTVERLIYEDWRDQMSRKLGCKELLTNEEFQELIRSLSARWLHQGVLKRVDIHGELEPYGNGKALLEKLRIGRVLQKENGQWVVDPRYLVLGLGLMLADEVKQVAKGGEASMDEIIATRLEPQRDMDLKVSICGMAFLHALYLEDYPETGRLRLFRAWIRGRNIQPEDWLRVPAYLPLRPQVYLRMAEYLWSTEGENREAQDVFMAGFLRFGRGEKVRAALVPTFERWMGFVHPDGHRGRRARDEEERKKGRKALQDALGSDSEYGAIDLFGYRLELTREEGWLRLAAVVLAVISHQERAPYIPAMATYALAGAVMGHPWYESAFSWVLRTAPDTIEATLLGTARKLMSIEVPTAQRAAWWLLTGLYTADALELRDEIAPEYGYKNPMRRLCEENPCGGFFLWDRQTYKRCVEETRLHPTRIATQLREVILDPHLEIPEQLPEVLDNAGKGIDLNSVWSGRGKTAEDSVLEEIEPALCACGAECLAEIWRILCGKLVERAGQPRYLLAWGIYEHLLIMRDEERQAIEQAWRATLESNSEEDNYAEYLLFPCVLSEKSLEEQLDLIQQRGDHSGHFTEYPPRIGKLKHSDLPALTKRLDDLVNRDHKYSHNLLWQLAYSLPTLDEALKKTLLKFYREGDTVTRGLCLQIFANTEDREVHRFLMDEGWRADRAGGDFERRWGSVLLCQAEEIPFIDLAERICPSLLGYAIQHRGNRKEEVLAYGELMNKIWSGIAKRQPEQHSDAHRTTVRSHIVEPNGEVGYWKISDEDESNVQFISWDSVWGGRVGEGSPDSIQQAFDFDARLRKLNEANQRLHNLVEAERRAGNPWFLQAFERSAFAEVVAAYPQYVKQWVNAVMDDTPGANTLLSRCRGFYEALCTVLLNKDPETGVQLFSRLQASNVFVVTDSTTQIDSILFGLFAAENSEPVIKQRRQFLENCNTDKCLFEVAFLAQFHGRQDDLRQVVEEWLASKQPFNEARGLTLLGFMDSEIEGARLRERIANQRVSWISSRAEIAERVYQRNQWAKHWFRVFLFHEEDLKAWAAFRLFLHCVDRRFWLWGPKMLEAENTDFRRKEHYRANLGKIRKASMKNEKDVFKLEKRFVGTEIKENQVWPWMSRYLSRGDRLSIIR